MDRPGYAIVSPDGVDWKDVESGLQHVSLTDHLGCAHTTVDRYRTLAGASVPLPAAGEQLCVSLDGEGTLAGAGMRTGEGTRRVRPLALVLVPAGTAARVASDEPTTWLVVGASADPAPARSPSVVEVEGRSFEVPTTSDIPTARLTDRLGCRGMKVNARRLKPGDAVPYHTEGTQEELFVPLDGAGTIHVDGQSRPAPTNSVTRVAPALPRSAANPGERDQVWLMVGSPPSGSADEWDPGAEIHEWPGHDW